MSQLNVSNLPGKTQSIISVHVPLSVKNKVWAYTYVDLGSLLANYNNPDEEEQFDFFPDHINQCISFKPSNKHAQITNIATWNKAFRVLIELSALKWPHLCLPMVQYMHIINKESGKFPFAQIYSYDKCFRRQLAGDPTQPWNQINN